MGPYGDFASACDQRLGEISFMFVDAKGGIGSRRIEIDNCQYRDVEKCGPVDGRWGDDLPLANSALVGCAPRCWLTESMHVRIEERMRICDAESIRRDYLGLLDDWHLDPCTRCQSANRAAHFDTQSQVERASEGVRLRPNSRVT